MHLLTLVSTIAFCAQGSAQWSTDALSEARGDLGATSVGPFALFAGGNGGASLPAQNSAVVDIYDARTGTWQTASLLQPRRYVSAASAGGLAVFTGLYYDHVDVFDSVTGQLTSMAGPPGLALRGATGTPGKILFGGGGFNVTVTDRVDIYDTVSATWSVEFLSQVRTSLAATSVGNLALFAGGCMSGGACLATVDILDTATNAWSTAALSQARAGLAATSVGGKALFAGGSPFTDRVDIYDVAGGTWSQASLSEARHSLTATTVGPYAIFAGGYKPQGQTSAISDRVDIYDSTTGTWSTATLSVPRSSMAAAAVGNRALLGGGWSAMGGSLYSDVVDVFDAELGTMYCSSASPNSTGLPALLRAEGSLFVTADDVTLIAEQLPPGQFGYFITGLTQGFIQPPGSQGPICLSGNIGRYNRSTEIIQGPVGSLQLDLTSMPVNPPLAAMPGDTWNFQCWYRDVNPASTSNTTNGLAVTFATTGVPAVQFAVTQASIVEDTTQLEVRLTLSQPTDQDVVLPYAVGGTATLDVDWRVEEPNPFVIPAGRTRADMTLVIAEDGVQETDESAIVSLAAPMGAVLGTQTTFTLTIVDDD